MAKSSFIERNKAVRRAWIKEQELVQEGQGTREWTPEQQKDILEKGRAYDENGKAFEGQHMKSAEQYPKYQGCLLYTSYAAGSGMRLLYLQELFQGISEASVQEQRDSVSYAAFQS